MISTELLLPDQHKTNSKQQYRTTTIHKKDPIYNSTMSKQYSTYTVTIALFSCPPREATLAARDPHFPPGIPFKLSGNIYLIIYMSMKQRFWRATAQYGTADIFLCGHPHHSDIDGDRLRRHISILLCGDIYIIGTSRNGNFGAAQASQGQGRSAMFSFFCFLCFVSFSRSFVNKD